MDLPNKILLNMQMGVARSIKLRRRNKSNKPL
jgi:hypothetical protein